MGSLMANKPQPSDRPLSGRERFFVEKYMALGGGRGAGKPAALACGYKESSASVMACRVLQREPVQREIEKRQRARLRLLAPRAVDAVEEILDDTGHKDRLKAAGVILNRIDPLLVGVAHQHNVTVESSDQMALKALRLLREMGATRRMLEEALGSGDLPRLEELAAGNGQMRESEPVTIEAEALEVESDDDLDDPDEG
jgi:hypothetical protein